MPGRFWDGMTAVNCGGCSGTVQLWAESGMELDYR